MPTYTCHLCGQTYPTLCQVIICAWSDAQQKSIQAVLRERERRRLAEQAEKQRN